MSQYNRRALLLARARYLRFNPTYTEAKLWQAIRGKRLGVHFRRQQVIGDASGQPPPGVCPRYRCGSRRLTPNACSLGLREGEVGDASFGGDVQLSDLHCHDRRNIFSTWPSPSNPLHHFKVKTPSNSFAS